MEILQVSKLFVSLRPAYNFFESYKVSLFTLKSVVAKAVSLLCPSAMQLIVNSG